MSAGKSKRIAVKCYKCGAVVAYLFREIVERAAKMAGWGSQTELAVQSAVTLGQICCPACEQKVYGGGA